MEQSLAGLAHLLEVLGSSPHPDVAARAIVEGPGAPYGAECAAVLWARPPHLLIVGSHGYRPEEASGLPTIHLAADYPLCQAYLEGEVIIVPHDVCSDDYAGLARPGSRWQHLRRRLPDGDMVSAPIHSQGHAVGAFSMNLSRQHTWTSVDVAILDAVSHVLGMWMTNHDSGIPLEAEESVVESDVLTPRQRLILGLVAEGRTNLSISHTLGISLSTVKQEVSRAMDLLEVADRRAAAERAADLGLLTGGSG
jgi:DNA-binding CsgD family transcriptional regulator